jgi:hypothetical protein
MAGLIQKYCLTKRNGSEVDPDGVYFVLKFNSKDPAHAKASQEAALVYADQIEETIPELAIDLRNLIRRLQEAQG